MQKFLIYFSLVILTTGCRSASLDADVLPLPASTPQISPTDLVEAARPISTQATLIEPAPGNPVANATMTLWKGNQMPIFLEVIQTTIMSEKSVQSPVLGVGPVIYFYDSNSKVLTLHSTITLESTAELLVGVNTVLKTPGQVYEKKEIVQFPSAQLALIQISALDAETGMLNLVYDGEAFDLPPGESRMFKQVGSGSTTSTVITQVLNHGILADIQPTSPDDSWR